MSVEFLAQWVLEYRSLCGAEVDLMAHGGVWRNSPSHRLCLHLDLCFYPEKASGQTTDWHQVGKSSLCSKPPRGATPSTIHWKASASGPADWKQQQWTSLLAVLSSYRRVNSQPLTWKQWQGGDLWSLLWHGTCALRGLEKWKWLCFCKGKCIRYVILDAKRQHTGLGKVKIDLCQGKFKPRTWLNCFLLRSFNFRPFYVVSLGFWDCKAFTQAFPELVMLSMWPLSIYLISKQLADIKSTIL